MANYRSNRFCFEAEGGLFHDLFLLKVYRRSSVPVDIFMFLSNAGGIKFQ